MALENIELKELLISATKAAGEYALANFKKIDLSQVRYKKGLTSPVTEVDLFIDRQIRKAITDHFPNHSIISEEFPPKEGDETAPLWIIDPIDGTGNYIKGSELFSVSVAVAINGIIEAGTIFSPALDDFYFVERGKGVVRNLQPLVRQETAAPICYYRRNHGLDELVSKLFPNQDIQREHLHCTSVEFERLAKKEAACAIYENIPLYDFAAGALMVEEAGGKVTDFDNKPYTIASKNLIVTA